MLTPRERLISRFYESIERGEPIIGGGAGIGLSAKAQEAGGVDLIVIYNSGRYRMAGRGSLAGMMPYGNANDIVLEMAREVIPILKPTTPVLAGVCGTDPFRDMGRFLKEIKEMGFWGVQNFPTVGLIDGVFRQNLEETGMDYGKEVEMIRLARELDLLTTPYVFSPEEAEQMVKAGADVVVAHMGLTTGGGKSAGAQTTFTLDDAVKRVQAIREAAVRIHSGIIVLCHGGPIASPDDARYVLEHVDGLHGFFGASSMERHPAEQAIEQRAGQFKGLRLKR